MSRLVPVLEDGQSGSGKKKKRIRLERGKVINTTVYHNGVCHLVAHIRRKIWGRDSFPLTPLTH